MTPGSGESRAGGFFINQQRNDMPRISHFDEDDDYDLSEIRKLSNFKGSIEDIEELFDDDEYGKIKKKRSSRFFESEE